MTTQSSRRVPEIIIDNWQGQYLPQSEIKAALTYLSYKTGRQVRFKQFEGTVDYSSDTAMFYIPTRNTQSSPRSLPAITLQDKKHPLSQDQPVFSLPLFEPQEVIKDEAGIAIAVVHYNCVISCIDFTGEDNEAARSILAYIVEKAVEFLDFDVSHLSDQRKERLLREYVECFRTAIQRRITEKEREENVLKADPQHNH